MAFGVLVLDMGALIDACRREVGSVGAVAERLGVAPGRVSELRAGRRKPRSSEILLMAEMAGLSPLMTLVEVQIALGGRHVEVWERVRARLIDAGRVDL